MSDFDKTDEQILEEIRSNSKKNNTIESMMYALLSTAEPHVVENFENQAVAFRKIGLQIGKQMRESENDPQKKKEWLSMLDRLQTGLAAGFETQEKTDENNS